MEIYELKRFKDKGYEVFNLETLKASILENKIESISLDIPSHIRKSATKEFVIMETDYENPFTLNSGNLYLNLDYYHEKKQEIDSILEEFLKDYSKSCITIHNKELINDKIIALLASNSNLRKVILTPYASEPYVLTERDYQIFKNSRVEEVDTKAVSESLKDNFNPLILYNSKRFILGYNRFQDLINKEEISLNDDLKQEDLRNLVYLNPKATLKLNCNDFSNIEKIIEALKSLKLENKVVINVKDKEKFNKFIFENNLSYSNLYVYYDFDEVNINDYLRLEKKLYSMILKAKDLSSFERYIVAYNVVKKYKKYRESEDKEDSRNLYRILENDFIVCRGFTVFFQDLLNKLGIESAIFSVIVDTSYDLANKGLEAIEGVTKVTTRDYHSRCYVRIKDEKYALDGFYITDPTWDNILDGDYYNHLALTEDEVTSSYRYNWLTNYSYEELLAVHSIEEFYQKINFFLDKLQGKDNDLLNLKNILQGLFGMYLDNLAPEFMEKLKQKYEFLNSYSWPSDLSDLLYDVGNFIVNHVNKKIPGSKILEAITTLYKDFYEEDARNISNIIATIKKDNALREDILFPKRSRIKDNEEIVIMNAENKFLDREKSKK